MIFGEKSGNTLLFISEFITLKAVFSFIEPLYFTETLID